jgi:hypothetical protein
MTRRAFPKPISAGQPVYTTPYGTSYETVS